jgi:hypothetical protein
MIKENPVILTPFSAMIPMLWLSAALSPPSLDFIFGISLITWAALVIQQHDMIYVSVPALSGPTIGCFISSHARAHL